ncbi:MAG: hypothetical protein ABIN95_06725 [Mucilaginibacter sp.]
MKILHATFLFLLFTLLLALPPAWFMYWGNGHIIIPNFWVLFSFISGLTFIAVIAILMGQQINPGMYAQVFMVVTTFKILACLSFIVVFLLNSTVDKAVFAGNFIYIYFLNTAFEVYVLLRNLRNQNLK